MSPVLEKINKSSLTAVSLLIGRQGLPKTVIKQLQSAQRPYLQLGEQWQVYSSPLVGGHHF